MPLPLAARQRAAAPLRAALAIRPDLRPRHTVPLDSRIWATYSTTLVAAMRELGMEASASAGQDPSFRELEDRVQRTLDLRIRLIGHLGALEPYVYFDHDLAEGTVRGLEDLVEAVATAVEHGADTSVDLARWDELCESWPVHVDGPRNASLGMAFGLDDDPVDDVGDFKAGRVFSAYKYDNYRLAEQIAPHFDALRIPMVIDMLACVSILGWIVSAPDPLVARATTSSFLSELRSGSPEVVTDVLTHFKSREGVTRQARQRVMTALSGIINEVDTEVRALGLADVYKRLVEGPVRQFGWALRCLGGDGWSSPPLLTALRTALVAQSGFCREVAEACVLVDLRNGEAHEDLEWDGHSGVFVVDGSRIPFDDVRDAVAVALSFDRGAEAAFAAFRSLSLRAQAGLPSATDALRMPTWQRAEAYFGTNGLELVRANFNGSTARAVLARLEVGDVNPCFQALLCARQLLPQVEVFEVSVDGAAGPVLTVSSDELDQAVPVWNFALETFDKMPFSAFLPANLGARSRHETVVRAVRAVAWIATDDVLSAIDGGPDWLTPEAVRLLDSRLRLVELGLRQCVIEAGCRARITAVLNEIRAIRAEIPRFGPKPLAVDGLDELAPVKRIRYFWSTWGPVPRLPTVSEERADHREAEREPRPRLRPADLSWQTL